ncbi:hypothetical protein Scep_005114 [Stephania cephalantha]|uniref:Uncharacterized protein n=1 Tax=Stephania cephalantha TaxID=152367 RepID=A0AAP0KUL7_9MAGN
MPEDIHHLLDDHDEFMLQLMPPPRPPPRHSDWMFYLFLMVCAAMAFGIGVAYREGVDKASLFLLDLDGIRSAS